MSAIIRIVVEAASFRLRRLEMANMVAAGAIAIALRHAWTEVGWRLAFAFGLNVLVYLNNDVLDVEQDLDSNNKDRAKTQFLADHLREAWVAQAGLLALLVAAAGVLDLGLLLPLAVGGGVCWAYSVWLKRLPVVDVLAMVAWGAAMPAVAFAPDSILGWALVGQLALFSGAFESTQVLRDRDEDAALGVRTSAVVLGERNARRLVALFVLAAAVYGGLILHAVWGWLPAAALALPRGEPARDWNRLRGIAGLAFLAVLFFVWRDQALSGIITR